jgi:MerR family redox-sensitive transcriptional activator SoxR
MTIGELSLASGLPSSTIRYWERIGVLPRPPRVSGQRRYSADALHTVAVLRLAQSCGFHLDEMRQLLHGFRPGVSASSRWRELAQQKKIELGDQIERLKAMQQVVDRVLKCNCVDLADCGRIVASRTARPDK